MMRSLVLLIALAITLFTQAQETFPVNGTVEKDVVYTALVNANVHVDFETRIEGCTLLVFKGRVHQVGTSLELPDNCVIKDVRNAEIYPGFVDLYSDYGMPKVKTPPTSNGPQYETNKKGAFGWNQAVKPEIRAAELFSHNDESAKSLRQMGFTSVMTHQKDGIIRGSSCFVNLGSNENEDMILSESASHLSFRKGSSTQKYPNSLMGVIALIRQTYYDAQWYNSGKNNTEENLSLKAFQEQLELPQVFDSRDRLSVLRADKIGDEFNIQYVFKGNGDEYQRLEAMKNTEGAFIVPISFPESFDVTDPYVTRMVSLTEMKHWEMAPYNASYLDQAKVPFAITSDGHKGAGDFLKNLRKAVKCGLDEGAAIRSLTYTPALIIGAESHVGHLSKGAFANFIVCSGNLFDEKTIIYETWVNGQSFIHKDMDVQNLSGVYNLNLGDIQYELKVSGDPGSHQGKIYTYEDSDTLETKVKIEQHKNLLTLNFNSKNTDIEGTVRLSGNVNLESRIWDGQGQLPDGTWIEWVAVRQSEATEESKSNSEAKNDSTSHDIGSVVYPFMAYGWDEAPEQKTYWIKNATIWTCEEDGKIENGEIIIHEGRIAAIGRDLNIIELFPKQDIRPEVIDAKGKHLTPGIIDEHSHIAITRGVNEGTQASSAEVNIGTVVNSDDINIYRQLAGGVTASQLLHGSANPIGGQSGMIKLRWGRLPDEMLVEDAAPFIKFALGENVKQSNWGDDEKVRFPQTRMGVEQVYYDHFIKAREYGVEWDAHNESMLKVTKRQRKRGELPVAPRRDLEMETLLQILRSERFVTCHSYRQDEINMLMHVADSMGFTLNTFTHILEGYKVADKMAAHGAGGSSFSDWWAYKFEVKDAIPHNGALLWEQGIVTAFNSDDREMARRLNQEAAKAVKYGGVPEEEALKFVTLNPAKLLHLDDKMGSIKVGKDADIVIWDDHPLSIYAKAEKTFVDGICYFDFERDEQLRKEIKVERARLIQKMLNDGNGKKRKPSMKEDRHYHCDTEIDEVTD